jgi:hypothetical protein
MSDTGTLTRTTQVKICTCLTYVMQFDHLGEDKDRDIAALVASPVSLARLEAEIAKCEVVCANCPRRAYAPATRGLKARWLTVNGRQNECRTLPSVSALARSWPS